jgi:glycosyltransferase involved in cell wall biosynthesis
MAADLELTIVMPCLNEAETLAACIRAARGYLTEAGIAGEVLVADNGSSDGSREIAISEKAHLVDVPTRGYGAALLAGIRAAKSPLVVMGDSDCSYDFSALDPFVEGLRAGADLVIGNRFKGGIEAGAMPWSHRYIGNPALSFLGRWLFGARVGDFHCGLRGARRQSLLELNLTTSGMEFASEMVVKASLKGQRVTEVPTLLRRDGRSRPPHLRSFRDGWRHLRFLLLFSPNWLYLYPGLLAWVVGLALTIVLVVSPVRVGPATFDIGTLIYTAMFATVGYQALVFGLLAKAYGVVAGFLPPGRLWSRLQRFATLEVGLVVGVLLVLAGLLAAAISLIRWRHVGFGSLDPSQHVRVVLPAAMGVLFGVQTALGSAFLGIIAIARQPQSEPPDWRDGKTTSGS